MEIIIDTPYVTLSYDKEIKLLEMAWKASNFTSEQYRDAFLKAVEYGKNNTVDNYLSDIREQKIVSPVDRKWF